MAVEMKFLADIFMKLIKMCIAPLVFLAVVHGICSAGNLKEAGRVGIKALIYFEVVTTLAMLCGWGAGELLHPGRGMNVTLADLDPTAIASMHGSTGGSVGGGILALIPGSLLEPLIKSDILQVLVVAILTGCVLLVLGDKTRGIRSLFDQGAQLLFGIMRIVTALAPAAAFGAISFAVAKFGLASLRPMMLLVVAYYAGAFAFLTLVLWSVLRWCGIGMWPLLRYIKEELFIVFATISSEAVMPRLITKLETIGCKPSVVRLVMPTAYSFNLDGTALYIVLAPLFIAQAMNIDLTWIDKLSLFGILLLTSKGAAGVTAGVMVTLVSTLTANPIVPAAGITIVLGVDRFMNEGRAVINAIGNVVATLAVCNWEGELDKDLVRRLIAKENGAPIETIPAMAKLSDRPREDREAALNGLD
jgi:aerobic C4-dicarboxylate transport protein